MFLVVFSSQISLCKLFYFFVFEARDKGYIYFNFFQIWKTLLKNRGRCSFFSGLIVTLGQVRLGYIWYRVTLYGFGSRGKRDKEKKNNFTLREKVIEKLAILYSSLTLTKHSMYVDKNFLFFLFLLWTFEASLYCLINILKKSFELEMKYD